MSKLARKAQSPARKELKRRNRVARSALAYFETHIDLLRQNARASGYALAVHGSLLRDVDLLAMPWTDEAKSPKELVESLFGIVRALASKGDKQFVRKNDLPTIKPHNRIAWSIHVNRDTYIDLSVVRPFK